MKNYILVACAVASLYLSFTFQYDEEPAATKQETRLPEESLLWMDEENTLSPESYLQQSIALQYQPVPELAEATKKNSKKKRVRKPRKLKSDRRLHADSLKLAFMQDKDLQKVAAQWLGTPYRPGNNSRRGTDCSGFVQKIYKQVYGINLSRSSRSMFDEVQPIAQEDLREGDLVFFKRKTGPIYHVGIYLKDGKFIHSASNGGVMVNSINSGYYNRHFYAAGRVSDIN